MVRQTLFALLILATQLHAGAPPPCYWPACKWATEPKPSYCYKCDFDWDSASNLLAEDFSQEEATTRGGPPACFRCVAACLKDGNTELECANECAELCGIEPSTEIP